MQRPQTIRIDTHDDHVIDPVWELYRLAHRLTGGAATLLEWDANIPAFPVVHAEVLKSKQYMTEALAAPNPETRPKVRSNSAAAIPHPLTHQMVAEVM